MLSIPIEYLVAALPVVYVLWALVMFPLLAGDGNSGG